MTNKNSPSVKIVAGNVSNMSNGFTMASRIARTIATINAVKMLSIFTPGKMQASRKTLTVEINILSRNFIYTTTSS